MNICTIIAKNYLAQARVLSESFLRHHPDGDIAVLVIDDVDGYIDPADVPFELIGIDSIGLDQPEEMAAAYDVTEFSTAVKPWLLRTLLARTDCDAITFLDPDIWILDDLSEVERLTLEHGLVLNPHFTRPLPRDGLRPSDEDILIAGIYNLGFISLRGGTESETLLDWWSERLRRDCMIDPNHGHFVDQRWIDLAAGIWPDPYVLRDPGYNLAYWNLPSRELSSNGERYLVDGKPLRFFHFSGFDPLKPQELSCHQNRIDISSSKPLARICNAYVETVLAAGYERTRSWPYGWDTLPGGLRLDRYSRRLYREALNESRMNGSVFSRKGAKNLLAYLSEPDEGAGAGSGISRYLGAIYRSREDLRRAFPDLRGPYAERFLEWAQLNADSIGIPPNLRPAKTTARSTRRDRNGQRPVGGVNLAGYLSSELGVGEAARQLSSAMSAVGIETAMIDLPPGSAEMMQRLQRLRDDEKPFDINLICVNADMVPEFAAAAGPSLLADRYSVGMWFWEVGRLPERSRGSFGHLDEVWVASRYVADAIRPDASVPVETIRLPVTPHSPDQVDREALGMPAGYCFLFIFDHRSVLKRKNPLGLIESFTRAFDPGSNVSLVIKSVGGEERPDDAAMLRDAAAAHPNVHLIETVIGPGAKNAMIANCDCYVSLHRSEGFGLTLAEAMYFGKPVIATGYSGNLDFMTEENSYLVAHTMAHVGNGASPYSPEAIWAEPDLDHAATLMRRVFENTEDAAGKGKRAAADIRRTHSPEAAGTVIEARLKKISERNGELAGRTPIAPEAPPDGGLVHAQAPPHPVPPGATGTGRAQLRHLLEFEQAPPRPGAGRLRRAAKRFYLRLLRPYAAYQRRISESTAEALEEVRADLAGRLTVDDERAREELNQLRAELREQQETLAERTRELRAALMQQLDSVRETAEGFRETAEGSSTNLNKALTDDRARVDRLSEEQAELAATVGSAAGDLDLRLASAESQIKGQAELAARVNASIADLWAHLEKLMTDVEESVKRNDDRVDRLGDEQAEQAARVEASIADLWAHLEKLMTDVEESVKRNDDRADRLGDEQAELAARVEASIGDLRAHAAKLAADVEESLKRDDDRVDRLGDEQAELVARVEASIGDLRAHAAKLTADVEESLKRDDDRVDRLGDEQAEQAARVEASIGDLWAGVKKLLGDVDATFARDHSRVDQLADEQAELAAAIKAARGELDLRLAGAESLVNAAAAPIFASDELFDPKQDPELGKVVGFNQPLENASPDLHYKGFGDTFRGTEEMIKDRQHVYLGLVRGFAPVLDAGCGRGEFLDLLTEAGMKHMGVDIDPGMVARCHEKGHREVVQADAVDYIDRLSPGALGTVFSAQLIEHLEFEQLKHLLNCSIETLRPGGLFIAESVNPHSPQALRAFWLDPTHQKPIYPETLLALCRLAGFASAIAFCPGGSGDYDEDRRTEGDYAVVARTPEHNAGKGVEATAPSRAAKPKSRRGSKAQAKSKAKPKATTKRKPRGKTARKQRAKRSR
jgi:glycosyltransferase involved in cell wall biosynthesis/SAM-dependent methyltransferase